MRPPASLGPYGYARSHRILELVGITLFWMLQLYFAVRIGMVVQLGDGWHAAALASSLLAGYLLSDFLSGLVHWAGDTIGDERIPVLGKHFVRPFRMHHVDPKDITRHDFVETNGNNSLAVLPILFAFAVVLPARPTLFFYACVAVIAAQMFVFLTNQFHKWAHADHPPPFARRLQRWGIILSPEHHEIHHRTPHDTHYCITVGWMNPVLHRVRFFRALEWMIAMVRPKLLHLAERQPADAGHERIATPADPAL